MKKPKENKVLVSIIILSLLRQRFTQQCLKSIFKYTKVPFEIIIVDMGESETIVAWLKKEYAHHPQVKLILNPENVGTTRGRNQGAKIAAGENLVFLDNDIRVIAGWLEPMLETINSDEKIAACGAQVLSQSQQIHTSPQSIKAYFENDKITRIGLELLKNAEPDDPMIKHSSRVDWWPLGCFMINKNIFDQLGGLDENLFLCEEDKDLSLSLRKFGYQIMYVPDTKVIHSTIKSSDKYASYRMNLKRIFADKRYFENKWQCKVFIDTSWLYLRSLGLKDEEIEKKRRFDFTTNIIDDRNELL